MERDTINLILEKYPVEKLDVRRAVVKMAVMRAVIRDNRMRRELVDEQQSLPRYSIRVRKIVAVKLPDIESGSVKSVLTMDKQDPLAMFTVRGTYLQDHQYCACRTFTVNIHLPTHVLHILVKFFLIRVLARISPFAILVPVPT